jgi:hypothetical protein
MDEYTVKVGGLTYLVVTTGEGSDFLVEHCEREGREIKPGTDLYDEIYMAAFDERRERVIGMAESLGG